MNQSLKYLVIISFVPSGSPERDPEAADDPIRNSGFSARDPEEAIKKGTFKMFLF